MMRASRQRILKLLLFFGGPSVFHSSSAIRDGGIAL